ncbi:unnamed protein product [Mytilus coruscus]|uniref:Uncharacterized protein n=1 Tax=Mytilus coruscus TaxID=42192 RepID=A0A6J8ENP9_MYTCO|nr:unnamed protein product [Mytilus coruscus]
MEMCSHTAWSGCLKGKGLYCLIQNMIVPILFFAFLTVVNGLLHTSHDGTLQCQCTCTPVGIPNEKIYTSGNLNIIDKKTSTNNEQLLLQENITMDKQETKPQIAPAKLPVDKTIKQFNDIAVSKIKHSLGLGVHKPIYETIRPKAVVKPEIKWSHTASSSSNVVTKDAVKGVTGKSNLVVTNSLMKHKDTPISEVLVNKPTIEKINGNDGFKSKMEKQSNTPDGHGTVIGQVKTTTDKVLSRVNSNQNKAVNQNIQQRFVSSSQDADKVAADIGFVMDGSSLNPILSGGLSGGMGYSSGTGYIVETINKNSPENQDTGKFVERNANVQNGHVVSGVLNPSNSKPEKGNIVGGNGKQKATNVWNNLNNNVKNNNNQKMMHNDQIRKTRWPNNNQQTDGNMWNTQQMKPFQIQQDLKQGVLSNNNNQWGSSNTWGATQDPFGTMNMDPLLFLGQHQFK